MQNEAGNGLPSANCAQPLADTDSANASRTTSAKPLTEAQFIVRSAPDRRRILEQLSFRGSSGQDNRSGLSALQDAVCFALADYVDELENRAAHAEAAAGVMKAEADELTGNPDPLERMFVAALAGMGVPIYHPIREDEDLDACTRQLWRIAQSAIRTRPKTEGGAS